MSEAVGNNEHKRNTSNDTVHEVELRTRVRAKTESVALDLPYRSSTRSVLVEKLANNVRCQ